MFLSLPQQITDVPSCDKELLQSVIHHVHVLGFRVTKKRPICSSLDTNVRSYTFYKVWSRLPVPAGGRLRILPPMQITCWILALPHQIVYNLKPDGYATSCAIDATGSGSDLLREARCSRQAHVSTWERDLSIGFVAVENYKNCTAIQQVMM
jgi:hypothetical protein